MSGRKATEVSRLLSKGSQIRQAGEQGFKNILNKTKETINKNEKEIDKIINNINDFKVEFSKESLDEFPKEVKLIKKQFGSLKDELKKEDYKISSIETKFKNINLELVKLDEEAQHIKRQVQYKSHYCDAEYNMANQLVDKYERTANEKNVLINEINRLNIICNQELNKFTLKNKQMLSLKNDIKALNKKVEDIVLLRKEASKAKSFIDELFNGIEEEIGIKFMSDEYKELVSKKSEFLKMNDEGIVKNLNDISEIISDFSYKINQKHQQFILEKTNSEKLLETIKENIKNSTYYHPMKYVKNQKTEETINVIEFLKSYGSSEYVGEINSIIEDIENLIEKEQFKEADIKSNSLNQTLEKALSYATLKQENIIKNITLALDIRKVMRNMNYETSANIIDNDITNGFSITCTVGDEIIEFDQVIVDDEGKITIDIDHTEGMSGTCANRWPSIQNALRDEGVFIEDITKNSKSILYSNKGTTSKVQEKRVQNRG